MKATMRRIVIGTLATLLVACGGGGGGSGRGGGSEPGAGGGGGLGSANTPCTEQNIFASLSYSPLWGNVGTPITSMPVVSGVPASCTSATRFAVSSGALPPGLSLHPITGVVSGTPTASGEFEFEVRLTVENVSGSAVITERPNINDVAAYTFTAWEEMTKQGPFLSDFQIATLGGKLYVVSRGVSSHVVETFVSTDGGATWTLLGAPGPAGDLRGFALAADASFIYLSGGSDGTSRNSGVWRFDGAAWTQVTVAGAFAARERHAMVSHGGALYILGGRSGITFFDDTWRSTDGGATWALASATGIQQRYDFCAVSNGGYLYVTGGKSFGPLYDNGGVLTNAVFRSTNGSGWTELPVSSTSPLLTTLRTFTGACAVLGGRIMLVGDSPGFSVTTSYTVSSADGITWNYEPHHPVALSGVVPGGTVLGGRLYVTAGSGTSQRTVARTVP